MTERRDIATRFQPGHAKLGGREKGARNKLGDQFLKNLRDDFATHGRAVIQHVRENDTSTYFTTVARLLPREVSASLQVQQKLPGNGSPEDWDTIRWMIDDTHTAKAEHAPLAEIRKAFSEALQACLARRALPAIEAPPTL
jgi:hypothetical protein